MALYVFINFRSLPWFERQRPYSFNSEGWHRPLASYEWNRPLSMHSVVCPDMNGFFCIHSTQEFALIWRAFSIFLSLKVLPCYEWHRPYSVDSIFCPNNYDIIRNYLTQEFALTWLAFSVFLNSGINSGMNGIVRIQLTQDFNLICMALSNFL